MKCGAFTLWIIMAASLACSPKREKLAITPVENAVETNGATLQFSGIMARLEEGIDRLKKFFFDDEETPPYCLIIKQESKTLDAFKANWSSTEQTNCVDEKNYSCTKLNNDAFVEGTNCYEDP